MIADAEIGGAYVRRTFTRGHDRLVPGEVLSGDEVRAMKLSNRRALIDAGYIEVWPKSPVEKVGSKVIVHIGGGRYDVFAMRLNDEPLTKEEAEALAAGHEA